MREHLSCRGIRQDGGGHQRQCTRLQCCDDELLLVRIIVDGNGCAREGGEDQDTSDEAEGWGVDVNFQPHPSQKVPALRVEYAESWERYQGDIQIAKLVSLLFF